MTNPPNQPRDDRRKHEGDGKGVGEKVNEAKQDDVTPERERNPSGDSSTVDRSQPSALGGEVATRSNA